MKLYNLTIVSALAVLLALSGCTRGEEKKEQAPQAPPVVDEHTRMMAEQHQMMINIQRAWAEAQEAVKKGKPSQALVPLSEIRAQASRLDTFMLHKNADRQAEFREKAAAFRRLVDEYRHAAETGDAAKLNSLAPKIDAACEGCHAVFR